MCDLRRETYDELAVANTTCRLVNTNRRFILDKSSPKKTDVSFKQCAIMKSGNILDTPIDFEKTILMDAHEKLERVDQMLYQRANLKETIDNRFISVIHSRIRIYFNVWLRVAVDYRSAQFLRHHHLLSIVEFNSRMLLKLKNQQSVNHFHIKLKTRSILLWVLYCKRKQHKYTLMKTANTFYRRHILQYYITCWHKNYFLTGESISQKHLLSAARAYNRRKILNKALCTWIVRKQIWQDKVNTSIVRSIFKQWFQQIFGH
ncbi:unnamed protein product [Heterobilharzia americana]|nr:unnamed protein product [Heterobilharzia americana]